MTVPRSVLLVAATAPELGGRPGLACGVGPVEAAARVAARLVAGDVDAVLHVGIAGARGIPIGAVVVGTAARYLDLAAGIPVVDEAMPDPGLLRALRDAFPDAAAAPIGTSAAVGSTAGVARAPAVEAMEGFGVLRACAIAGVPAVELRVVSNAIGEADRARWDIAGALAQLAEVTPRALAAAGSAPLACAGR